MVNIWNILRFQITARLKSPVTLKTKVSLNHYRGFWILWSALCLLLQSSSSEKIVSDKWKRASRQLATGVIQALPKHRTTLLILSNISISILKIKCIFLQVSRSAGHYNKQQHSYNQGTSFRRVSRIFCAKTEYMNFHRMDKTNKKWQRNL